MTEQEIDIEALVAEIGAARSAADAATPLPTDAEAQSESDLYACLAMVNQSCSAPRWFPRLRGLARRLTRKLLGPDSYDQQVVRTLNRMVKVLDGSQDDLNGEILAATRTRLGIVTALSQRLTDLEAEVATLRQSAETDAGA
jgi:hypothetical protein